MSLYCHACSVILSHPLNDAHVCTHITHAHTCMHTHACTHITHTHMHALTLNELHLQKQCYTCMNNQWSTFPLKIDLDVMQSHPLHWHCWWVGPSVNPLANYLHIHPTKLLYMHLSTISMCDETIPGSHSPIPHTHQCRWLWQMVMVASPHQY